MISLVSSLTFIQFCKKLKKNVLMEIIYFFIQIKEDLCGVKKKRSTFKSNFIKSQDVMYSRN